MRRFTLLALLLLLPGLPATVRAQDACSAPLRVASSSVPSDKLADDTPIGRMIDELMPEVSRRASVPFTQQLMPRVRAFAELRAGRVDLVFLASRTPERDEHSRLVVMGRLKAALLVRRNLPAKPATAEELLTGKWHVLVVRGQEFGGRTAAALKELTRQGRLEVVSDRLAAVRMLGAGRADAIIGLPAFFAPALASAGLLEAMETVDANIADAVDEGIYVGKHVPEACFRRLLQAGSSLRESGAYRKLIERHFSPGLQAAFVE